MRARREGTPGERAGGRAGVARGERRACCGVARGGRSGRKASVQQITRLPIITLLVLHCDGGHHARRKAEI
eukprot:1553828-Pyramimonas_sp.AAC.1